jgi:asparagine synthase (glutamine-hydrolysing)
MVHLFREEQIGRLCPDIEYEGADMPRWPDGDDSVSAAMIWDRSHYLPFDILRKVDRAAMSNALEVRCPLLDTPVVEWAGRLSSHVLMRDKRLKALLRQVAARLLPDAIVQRRKKGFSVPIGRWFRDELRQPLTERLSDGGLTRLGLKQAPIDRMIDQHVHCKVDHTHRLFALLALSIWQDWLTTTSKAQATE